MFCPNCAGSGLNQKVVDFVAGQPLNELYMSAVTLAEEGRKTGHTFSQPDLIIAATAIQHGLTVVTRDRSDYDRAGVPVVNPWDAP